MVRKRYRGEGVWLNDADAFDRDRASVYYTTNSFMAIPRNPPNKYVYVPGQPPPPLPPLQWTGPMASAFVEPTSPSSDSTPLPDLWLHRYLGLVSVVPHKQPSVLSNNSGDVNGP